MVFILSGRLPFWRLLLFSWSLFNCNWRCNFRFRCWSSGSYWLSLMICSRHSLSLAFASFLAVLGFRSLLSCRCCLCRSLFYFSFFWLRLSFYRCCLNFLNVAGNLNFGQFRVYNPVSFLFLDRLVYTLDSLFVQNLIYKFILGERFYFFYIQVFSNSIKFFQTFIAQLHYIVHIFWLDMNIREMLFENTCTRICKRYKVKHYFPIYKNKWVKVHFLPIYIRFYANKICLFCCNHVNLYQSAFWKCCYLVSNACRIWLAEVHCVYLVKLCKVCKV